MEDGSDGAADAGDEVIDPEDAQVFGLDLGEEDVGIVGRVRRHG